MGRAARGLSAPLAALALALFTASASPAAAPPGAADCPGLSQLLRATALQPSVAWVTLTVRTSLARSDDDGALSTAEMERLGEVAVEAYSPMELARDIETYLAAHCNAGFVAQSNAFYRSATGVKIVRGGMEFSSQSVRGDRQDYFERLRDEGLASGRLELVRSVKSASLVYATPPRARLALLRPIAIVTFRAMATERGEAPPPEEEISRRVAAQSAELNSYFDLSSDLTHLYSTRELSDAELQEYRSFLGSAAGVWYQESLERAFESALDAAGARMIAGASAR